MFKNVIDFVWIQESASAPYRPKEFNVQEPQVCGCFELILFLVIHWNNTDIASDSRCFGRVTTATWFKEKEGVACDFVAALPPPSLDYPAACLRPSLLWILDLTVWQAIGII